MDTGVFGIDHVVALADGERGRTTWDIEAPAPLVTTILRGLHTGPVHDVGTGDGQLAILAKVLRPAQPANAWAMPRDHENIRFSAAVNAADIGVGGVDDFPPRPSQPGVPALIVLRSTDRLPVALACDNPRAILLLGGSDVVPSGYCAIPLDRAGTPLSDSETGRAATLFVQPGDLDATREELARGAQALADRSPKDPVPSRLVNHCVESALRLADLQRSLDAGQLADMQRRVDRALDQMNVAHAQCVAMRGSRSWRMTRFLRGF